MENISALKATMAATIAALTALWGWFGWLIIAFTVCMAMDYLTGTAAAIRCGKWSSREAWNGIWHKIGAVIIVIVAALLDGVVRSIISNFPIITLPFDYTVFFCPLVVVWGILSELGSIIENAGALGAPIPTWLVKAVESLGDVIDTTAGGANKETKK